MFYYFKLNHCEYTTQLSQKKDRKLLKLNFFLVVIVTINLSIFIYFVLLVFVIVNKLIIVFRLFISDSHWLHEIMF